MEPKKISANVTMYSADPVVYAVSNFLSDEECKAFVDLGKGNMAVSYTHLTLPTMELV